MDSPAHSFQRTLEISDQVIHALDSDRQPHQLLSHAHLIARSSAEIIACEVSTGIDSSDSTPLRLVANVNRRIAQLTRRALDGINAVLEKREATPATARSVPS